MEKLKKVIAGLVACNGVGEDCKNCPYLSEREKCSDMLDSDALAVLKEMDGKYRAAIEMAAIATERAAARSGGDLISRSELLESIEGTDWYTIKYNGDVSQGAPCEEIAWYKATDMYAAVAAAPAVDAERVVHRRWDVDKSFVPFVCTCSGCGSRYDTDGAFEWHYCPHCGAHMDEGVAV